VKTKAPPCQPHMKCHIDDCHGTAATGHVCFQFLCPEHWSMLTESEELECWGYHLRWSDRRIDEDNYNAFKDRIVAAIDKRCFEDMPLWNSMLVEA
jgi:hypothetical protein